MCSVKVRYAGGYFVESMYWFVWMGGGQTGDSGNNLCMGFAYMHICYFLLRMLGKKGCCSVQFQRCIGCVGGWSLGVTNMSSTSQNYSFGLNWAPDIAFISK